MNTFYYSDLCPDCPPFEAELQKSGKPYQSINITASMKNLKQFLKLRDTHPAFATIKAAGFAGVPCLHTADNQCFFEIEQL